MQAAEELARAAGLDRAWAEHRADVEEAIASANRLRAGFARPKDAAAEPLPAYAVGGAIQSSAPAGTAAIAPRAPGK